MEEGECGGGGRGGTVVVGTMVFPQNYISI